MATDITITVTTWGENNYEPVGLKVCDGDAVIAEGTIGGEPEDNNIVRDYRWIVPALKALAQHCGATVKVDQVKDPQCDECLEPASACQCEKGGA